MRMKVMITNLSQHLRKCLEHSRENVLYVATTAHWNAPTKGNQNAIDIETQSLNTAWNVTIKDWYDSFLRHEQTSSILYLNLTLVCDIISISGYISQLPCLKNRPVGLYELEGVLYVWSGKLPGDNEERNTVIQICRTLKPLDRWVCKMLLFSGLQDGWVYKMLLFSGLKKKPEIKPVDWNLSRALARKSTELTWKTM